MVIGICDDQLMAAKNLKYIVEKYGRENNIKMEIAIFLTGAEAINNVERLDILFLDIEMPEMDGIEVGKHLRQNNCLCKIIMATGRVERFKEAFVIEAFRFVSKPFVEEEIKCALEDTINTIIGIDTIELFENRMLYKIMQRDIYYINAYDSYIEVVTRKQKLRKDISLTAIEKILDNRIFYRLNRSYIVNLMHVMASQNGIVTVENCQFKVSRLRKKEFEKKMKEFDNKYR